jgi:glycosyltransferase involved in cell wall biosynthesis
MAVKADTWETENMVIEAPARRRSTARGPRGGTKRGMRVAINLLTEDPARPSGAHWFWTQIVPRMAARLGPDERLCLLVSPSSKKDFEDCGPNVEYLMFPWSNERRSLRTLTEHLYSPVRLPLSRIDVLNTLMAPLVNPTWSLVIHMKTMHAYTDPQAISPAVRAYRRLEYPRSARLADTIVINSKSLQSEINTYLDVDPAKFRLIYEAVDHDVFSPGDIGAARAQVAKYGIDRPFALFVSSLWQYKNCHGLLRAWAVARTELAGRQLVVVGSPRDENYAGELQALAAALGIAADVVFVGGVPLQETAHFYRAADVFVYPSFNETFGLPILEAMACGCPVVTSDRSSMPEIADGAAVLADPADPRSIAQALLDVTRSDGSRLREMGVRRAAQFTWQATAEATLDVYRQAADRRKRRKR